MGTPLSISPFLWSELTPRSTSAPKSMKSLVLVRLPSPHFSTQLTPHFSAVSLPLHDRDSERPRPSIQPPRRRPSPRLELRRHGRYAPPSPSSRPLLIIRVQGCASSRPSRFGTSTGIWTSSRRGSVSCPRVGLALRLLWSRISRSRMSCPRSSSQRSCNVDSMYWFKRGSIGEDGMVWLDLCAGIVWMSLSIMGAILGTERRGDWYASRPRGEDASDDQGSLMVARHDSPDP